jgi:nitrite reductase/ring-hydroxylating ferredoxin subunit/uncharacterized membrane protein
MRSKASIKAHPLHPILVAFPIGLWVASLIFDLIAVNSNNNLLWAAGFFCVLGGCIGAALAAIPGVIDLLSIVPPRSSAKQRGYIHGALNTTALLLFIAVAWQRGGPWPEPEPISLYLSAAGVLLVGISGWLGGTLVYRNQIAVDHRYANAGRSKERVLDNWSRPVCNQSELSEGQMMLARVGNKRVVVGKCSEGMFAFSDHCTHKGGPLSDGALVGCTVQCPWHGSQFDVTTGRVVAGPAEKQIKTYQIEIRAGEVYVKRDDEETKKAA